ncbi:MAG TPA: FG-GAP-like repeat-containing protein [Chthoniobacterales bacterium]|jgi:hypothetical protein
MKNTGRACLFILIGTIICSISPVLGQAIPRKPLSEGPLEEREDPPASIVPRQPKVTPKRVSAFGGFTSYQVNVDFNHNNVIGDAANEPSICVDPNNPNRMAIGWRQFDNVSSNFRQAGWAFTSNGGVTWTFPGVLQNNVFRSDPVLNSDSSGQFYYLSLLENFFDDIWRSVDGGQSFVPEASATGGDKQWFTIDNTNSSGHGFQYQAWSTAGNNYGGRQFSRSTDGGFSWLNPVAIPHSPTWGTLDVDSNGILYIGGVNQTTGQIWCVRSSNAKNAAVMPAFELSTPVNLGGNIGFSENINPEGLVGQINVVVDRSGTVTNNYLYMLGGLQRFGFNSGSDIMFVRSTDGGQTFSPPVRINDDPVNPNSWHWFGALAAAPNGRLDCVWLDTRNSSNNTDSQLFYSHSSDGGLTWAPNIPVSNGFNPYLGYPNQNKLGDYITIVSDNSGANVAYSATFNGEEDVYYLRIPATPTAIPKAKADFNGDGKSDIIWQDNSTGERAIWLMNGTAYSSGLIFGNAPTEWQIMGNGDFNGDGKTDIVWENSSTGECAFWFMNGTSQAGAANFANVPVQWQIATTGDFNGDGRPDIVWQNTSTGDRGIWFMSGATYAGGVTFASVPTEWKIVGAGDFNGDSKTDILWQNSSTGECAIWFMNGASYVGGSGTFAIVPAEWRIAGTGDFNNDSKPDIVWQNTSTGERAIWLMNGAIISSGVSFGIPPVQWDIRNH